MNYYKHRKSWQCDRMNKGCTVFAGRLDEVIKVRLYVTTSMSVGLVYVNR